MEHSNARSATIEAPKFPSCGNISQSVSQNMGTQGAWTGTMIHRVILMASFWLAWGMLQPRENPGSELRVKEHSDSGRRDNLRCGWLLSAHPLDSVTSSINGIEAIAAALVF